MGILPSDALPHVTRRRDIVYRGNIDPGERVIASLLQVQQEERELATGTA
jgi:hypothetical protein